MLTRPKSIRVLNGKPVHGTAMDQAYEDNQTLQLALDFGYLPVIPPRHNRLQPWQYDKALYRKRNEIERLFRRLKLICNQT